MDPTLALANALRDAFVKDEGNVVDALYAIATALTRVAEKIEGVESTIGRFAPNVGDDGLGAIATALEQVADVLKDE